MKDKIFSNSSNHFLVSILSTMILGQENGRTLHCHLGDLMENRIMGLGQRWEEQKKSNCMLGPPRGEGGGITF
jgi:hypothetical protein